MEAKEATVAQVERFIKKIAQKFPNTKEPSAMTDIHIILSQDSGELLAFDDNDDEITRCVVEEWIGNKDDNFYDSAAAVLRSTLERLNDQADNLCILKPYSFILENDEREHCAELYLADSDIKIIGGDLMDGLEDDLNKFLDDLLK